MLSGGTAISKETIERMMKEMTALSLFTMKIRWLFRLGVDWRTYLVFSHHFQKMWISKGEYDEPGLLVVHSVSSFFFFETDPASKFHWLFLVFLSLY